MTQITFGRSPDGRDPLLEVEWLGFQSRLTSPFVMSSAKIGEHLWIKLFSGRA
jgi:hypothetical protein